MNKIVDLVENCPLCSGSSFNNFKLGLERCDTCGLILSPEIWHDHANERMEEEWFGDEYIFEPSFWINLFQSHNNRKVLSRLKVRGELLEIGIGSGSFLNSARNSGFSVMGCDLSPAICRKVENQYDLSVHCGPVEEIEGRDCFDVVLMNHVLEHVQRPVDFLKVVERLLVPGGIIHIAVPNVKCWESALRGWASYEPYHLTYFDLETLTRAVEMAGFSCESVRTYDSFSGWFLAALRTVMDVNKVHGAVIRPAGVATRTASGRRNMVVEHAYRLAMLTVGGVITPFRRLQGKLGYGDELVCIARKPELMNRRIRSG